MASSKCAGMAIQSNINTVEDMRSAADHSWPTAAEPFCPCKHADQE